MHRCRLLSLLCCTRPEDARLCGLASLFVPGSAVQHGASGCVFLVLRSCAYGAWLWPMAKASDEPETCAMHCEGNPEFAFLWDLDTWKALVTVIAAPCECGPSRPTTAWRVTAPSQPILEYALRHKTDMTVAQLKLILQVKKLKPDSNRKADLLKMLVDSVFENSEGADFAKKLLADILGQATAEEMEEAAVDEAVLESLE
eukprot:9490184-Pyramimonas_sp.AAC.1